MGFFEGSSNDAQWVALSLNILTIIVYSLTYKKWPERSILSILLAITIIIVYYTTIDKKLEGWNIGYFVASIIILFNRVILKPHHTG
jgi:predicted ferric reductase